MAKKIPFRLFNDEARAPLWESSGSDHSAEDTTDLSDLIDSFMERDDQDEFAEEEKRRRCMERKWSSDCMATEMLRTLVSCDSDKVKRKIRREIELACSGTSSCENGFKTTLVTQLRNRGFDAGLCTSRWEKQGHFPAGSYEYIAINVAGIHFIVEVFLAEEFKIARPTKQFLSLLDLLPKVFVGKPEELKQVVWVMCEGIKESMSTRDMYVPPWRTYKYFMSKWFGSP